MIRLACDPVCRHLTSLLCDGLVRGAARRWHRTLRARLHGDAGRQHDCTRHSGQPTDRLGPMLLRCAKQPADTREERPIGGANRQRHAAGPPRCQLRERRGIRRRFSADVYRDVVATVLTRLANPRRHPPDGRMKEQQRLRHRLQQVDGIVAAPDVGQLVREKRLDLAGRQAAERSDWQEDQRAHEPDDTRCIDERRFHDPERDRQPQPPGDPLARRLPGRCRFHAGCGSQPVHAP